MMESDTKSMKQPSWSLDMGGLLLVSLSLIGLFLGSHVMITPDEARYTEVAREMLMHHNWVTPMVNGVAFLDKPALFYWLQAISLQLFGINEWSIRLWPALFGVFGVLLTYVAGRQLYDRRTGLLAAMVLLTCPLYFFAAHYVNMDLEVAVLVSAALYCYLIAMEAGDAGPRPVWLWGAYACAGLAILTKGLLGLAFPMMIIGAWILCLQRWHLLRQMRLLSGLALALVIVAPWFIAVQWANPDFFHYFFVTQQISRFLTQGFNNQAPTWFYLPVVIVGLLPWSLFLYQAIRQQIRQMLHHQENRGKALYLLLWPLLILIFFSIPSSKIVGYILPVIPPLALIIGRYLAQQISTVKPNRGVFIVFSLCAVAMAIIMMMVLFSGKLSAYQGLYPGLSLIVLALFFAAVVMFLLRQYWHKLIFMALLTGFVSIVLMSQVSKIPLPSIKPFVATVNSHLTPASEVVSYHHFYQDLPLYLNREVVIVTNWDDPNILRYDNWRRELIYGIKADPKSRQWMINDQQFWQRWHGASPLLVFLSAKHLASFKAAAKSPVTLLQRTHSIALVTNKVLSIQ